MDTIKPNETVRQVPVSELQDHPRNIFRQMNEEELAELKESIRQQGIIHPLVVRPLEEGYQILSGHQRKRALEELGEETAPAIVRELSDEEAEVMLIDANVQTRSLSPMELAKAIHRKKDIYQNMVGNDCQNNNNGEGGEQKTGHMRDVIANELGISSRKIGMYDKLNDLIEPLQEMVDSKALGITTAEQLAHLDPETQELVHEILGSEALGRIQANELRKIRQENDSNGYLVLDLMNKQLTGLKEELEDYRTLDNTKDLIKAEIQKLNTKKRDLEYSLADTQATIKAVKDRDAKTGVELITLLEQQVKQLKSAQTKMHALLDKLVRDGELDPTNRAYCIQMACEFGEWERYILARLEPQKKEITLATNK